MNDRKIIKIATKSEQDARIKEVIEMISIGYSKKQIIKECSILYRITERQMYTLYNRADAEYRKIIFKDMSIEERFKWHLSERIKAYNQLIKAGAVIEANAILKEMAEFEGFKANRFKMEDSVNPEEEKRIQDMIEKEIQNRAKSLSSGSDDAEFEVIE